nr:hypothetical protein [Tanacetum cinerariifolium]
CPQRPHGAGRVPGVQAAGYQPPGAGGGGRWAGRPAGRHPAGAGWYFGGHAAVLAGWGGSHSHGPAHFAARALRQGKLAQYDGHRLD